MTDFAAASDEFFRAYNDCDIDEVERRLAPDLDFAHHNRGFATRARGELIAVLRQFVPTVMPDRKFSGPARGTGSGNTVMREATWSGDAREDIPGFGTTGEFSELQLCSVPRFDDDGITVEWKDY